MRNPLQPVRNWLCIALPAVSTGLLCAAIVAEEVTPVPVPMSSKPPTVELPETVVEAQRQAQGTQDPNAFPGPAYPESFPATTQRGRADNLIGLTSSASEGRFGAPEIERRPISRSAEVLELIPGMIATQHSGGGKANQYFLRGFNLDHGTDFALRVDGVPMNLPSHAHGQGYLDINWIIPEMIDYADYKLGTYYADVGDFSSAGAADIHFKRTLPQGFATLTGGTFDYYRLLVADTYKMGGGDFTFAMEQNYYNGPWDVPQNLNKSSGIAKWTTGDEFEGFSISAIGYHSDWNATNQIALRAFEAGVVGRFGSLDPTDGGNSSRAILNAEYWHDYAGVVTKANAYVAHYDMDLFSNFTYFLNDPINGDQIQQLDRRVTSGFNLSRQWDFDLSTHTVGFQFRNDSISKLQLNHTSMNQLVDNVSDDDVTQQDYGLYYQNQFHWTDMIRSTIGFRGDFYNFDVVSHDNPADSNNVSAAIFSPKTGLVFGPWAETELFLNWGQSFHSNDARGVTAAVDPATALVKSDGSEIGVRSWLTPEWNSTLTLWYLELGSELVFVGDEGTNEPSGASHRVGFNWTNYWKLQDWLTLDADYAYVKPRFIGGDRIPNAVNNVFAGGLTAYQPDGPWSATLRIRHFGPGALIEDNSARSSTTTLVNAQLAYQKNQVRVAFDFFNIFNRKDNDIIYYYESRPQGFTAANDYEFHPVEPTMVRVSLTYLF